MRKSSLILICGLGWLGMMMSSCGGSDSETPAPPVVNGESAVISTDISSCKQTQPDYAGTRQDDGNEEWAHLIEYQATDGGNLLLTDINHWVPCSMSDLKVEAVIDNDVITINEQEVTGDVVSSCICPIDVNITIGPMKEQAYTLVYCVNGTEEARFEITYAAGLKGSYDPTQKENDPRFLYGTEIGGLYYKVISSADRTMKVSFSEEKYSGDIVVPEEVTLDGATYRVTGVDRGAFSGCEDITSVVLPSSIIEIGDGAFTGCSQLASVTIPQGVTQIPVSAFQECRGLQAADIPESVTEIGMFAFSGCESLKTVNIGGGTTTIGIFAFGNCKELSEIHVLSQTPPNIDTSTFDETTEQNVTLYVPTGCKEAYSTADYWKNFANIVEKGYTE